MIKVEGIFMLHSEARHGIAQALNHQIPVKEIAEGIVVIGIPHNLLAAVISYIPITNKITHTCPSNLHVYQIASANFFPLRNPMNYT
jgi:hypothetical protein